MVFVSYDRTGNVLTADYAGEQTETNTYNELGLLTTVTTAEGDTLYQYDDASRLISVTQPNGETVSYTYDSHGNRATMTYPNGKTVKYTYDDMNRLIAVKGVDGATTKYSYDALGRRIATDGAKEDTVYAYDEVGNLVSQTTTGAYDLALEYAYDLSGRMTQESRTENGATLTSSYIYDALGQLTGFTRSDGQSETYTYDPVGNMTAKTKNGVSTTMRYNAANQLTSSVTGNDTTKYTYDANGNLTRSENAGGARSYAHNALNLLESFTREDGYTETYTYNANRLLSTIKTSEDLTTALTWDILYGDGVVISENQNGQTTSYTYGLERISAKTGSTRTEYVYDGRGSVAAELSYNTAWYTVGGLIARKHVTSKSYTPFGEQIGEAASGFGYNGEYYNAATGMIYLRARFYEPEMNRFGQKDLLRGSAFAPQSLNRYVYCWNDPMNFIDPSGMSIRDWGKNLVNKATNAWNTFTTGVKELVDVGQTLYYTLTDKPDPRKPANQPVDAISGAAPSVSKPGYTPAPVTTPTPTPMPTPNPVPSPEPGPEPNPYFNPNTQYTNSSSQFTSSAPVISSPTNGNNFSTPCNKPTFHDRYEDLKDLLLENGRKTIEKIREGAKNARNQENAGTVTIGVNLSAGFGGGGGLNVGIGFDLNGNIGIVSSYSLGAAMPSASAMIYISASNATSFDALGGESMVVGASGGELIVGGGEIVMFQDARDSSENKTFVAETIMGGLGVGVPVEFHGEYSRAETASFNIFDLAIALCDLVLAD